ncbi:MAG: class I SAM-dependent rRNA methyltransferase [Pseudomonadota bacterium]
MKKEARIRLAPRKAGAAIGGHPWLFRTMIGKIDGDPVPGDAVPVFGGDDDRFVAHGILQPEGEIAVRLYSWERDRPIVPGFFTARVKEAIALRRNLGGFLDREGACRLIFSEGDQLSGLIVDRFGEYLVVQISSPPLLSRWEEIGSALRAALPVKGIFLKNPTEDRLLWGEISKAPVRFTENRLTFELEIGSGQKTGFYLDQRENRSVVAGLVAGRKVLDLHCYTGGFALACAQAGAKEAVGVDSSKEAIQRANRHTEINSLTNVRFVEQDVFEFLKGSVPGAFDLVIVDPPKLIPTRSAKERGLRMYHRLNRDALSAVAPGGILVTCSCSGALGAEEWLSLLHSAARRSGRLLQVVEVRGASRDHPFSIHCPESRYLKCVMARVFGPVPVR